MKRILVPTDFSTNAYCALFYATQLFKNQECKFYILNTFTVETSILTSRLNTSKGDKLYKELSADSQDKLEKIKHTIIRDSKGLQHSFETISVSKKLAETIDKTVKSLEIDLVVMGTKGASGVKEIFMGSNTVKVIQKIKNCAILAVPDQMDFKTPKEIAFATDFKCFYTTESLKPLLEVTTAFGSNIRIMHIHEEEKLSETQEHNLNNLKEKLKDFNYCLHWIPGLTKKEKHIQEFIDKMNIDMLCMSQYKHGLIESITHEPVIKKIGFRATVPFLVIPEAS